MDRRDLLAAGAALGATGLAGCVGLFETQSARRGQFTTVEDRGSGVYHPTHSDGMTMIGMGGEGRYRVGLMYSYAHAFWTITGSETNRVDVGDEETVHVMATVWDDETGAVLPTANVSAEVLKAGETVDSRSLWTMLSQNMGYHFGDNMVLDGDGTYTARIEVGAMQARRTGGLRNAFEEGTTIEIEFDHERSTISDLPYEEFPDEQGTAAALEPMEMDAPIARCPEPDSLPGTVLGRAASGDAEFVAFRPDETPHFVDGEYLAVSPRTPYNRYPLPFMGLAGSLEPGGETLFDDRLEPAVDSEFGYHYGTGVDGVESGDSLTLTVNTPPGVARHEGYETAFIDMPPMDLTV